MIWWVARQAYRPAYPATWFSTLHPAGSICPPPPLARTGPNLPWHYWREYPPRHEHTTIPSWPANDPRQHARQRRAVDRSVLLAVPPPCDLERGPVARSRASASIRSAHGVHPARYHWCRRLSELAGTATAREPDRGAMAVSGEQRLALRLLAGSPLGATEATCWRMASRTPRQQRNGGQGGSRSRLPGSRLPRPGGRHLLDDAGHCPIFWTSRWLRIG
jgi:hypothetical protein